MNYQQELAKFNKKSVNISEDNLPQWADDSLYKINQKINELKETTHKNERIGKKSVIKLDQINKYHEKLIRKMDKVSDNNRKINEEKNEKEEIIDKLLFTYDQLYTIKEFVDNYSDSKKWQDTLDNTLKKVEKELKKIGLSKIPALGEEAEPDLHIIVDKKKKENIKKGQIIEVIKNGFFYKGNVFKEAEVITSK